MKRVTEPKKISAANFYAETKKVELPSGSSSVDFALGFEGSVKNFVALVKNGSFLVRITDMTILIEYSGLF